ncbi:MAG TPA: PEP-CTERM sorting domain-containing protein [Caldimonas sp.]|nr:PEP-CTERM sorting domain-containing protein [Caldimonas sp.]HEX4235619.1 PEP-CTERM sorting domain-containing protein [Caldimonas sp.]
MVQLAVADFLGPASAIFSTPAGDLSLLQPVDWSALGAMNIGQFNSGISSGQFTPTSLDVVAASPAPEPETLALLVAGLLAGIGRFKALQRRK